MGDLLCHCCSSSQVIRTLNIVTRRMCNCRMLQCTGSCLSSPKILMKTRSCTLLRRRPILLSGLELRKNDIIHFSIICYHHSLLLLKINKLKRSEKNYLSASVSLTGHSFHLSANFNFSISLRRPKTLWVLYIFIGGKSMIGGR